jgi:hypothetical protein
VPFRSTTQVVANSTRSSHRHLHPTRRHQFVGRPAGRTAPCTFGHSAAEPEGQESDCRRSGRRRVRACCHCRHDSSFKLPAVIDEQSATVPAIIGIVTNTGSVEITGPIGVAVDASIHPAHSLAIHRSPTKTTLRPTVERPRSLSTSTMIRWRAILVSWRLRATTSESSRERSPRASDAHNTTHLEVPPNANFMRRFDSRRFPRK